MDEVSGGEDGEGWGAGLEVFCVVGGEELAVVLDGCGENGQVFGIGETGEGVDFLPGGVGEDLQTTTDKHAKGYQRGWKFLLEVALDFSDNLLAGDRFDEGDLSHAQDDQAGTVLLGRCRPGEKDIGVDEDARLFRFIFHIYRSYIFRVVPVS